MKRILFIIGLATVLAHGLVSFLAGSFDPTDWSPLEKLGCIFIVAPLLALAIAIVDGILDAPPAITYSNRRRELRSYTGARARRER